MEESTEDEPIEKRQKNKAPKKALEPGPDPNPYEQARLERIAQNRARLEELQIPQVQPGAPLMLSHTQSAMLCQVQAELNCTCHCVQMLKVLHIWTWTCSDHTRKGMTCQCTI